MSKELREGDIEAVRRKMKLEGKPIKSTIIRDGSKEYHYAVKDGKVQVHDVLDDSRHIPDRDPGKNSPERRKRRLK